MRPPYRSAALSRKKRAGTVGESKRRARRGRAAALETAALVGVAHRTDGPAEVADTVVPCKAVRAKKAVPCEVQIVGIRR